MELICSVIERNVRPGVTYFDGSGVGKVGCVSA
jgi:hypothetical protein